MKRCAHCRRNKSVSEFNKNKVKKDGLQTFCKSCLKKNRTKKVKVVCVDCSSRFYVAHRSTNSYWRKRAQLRCKGCRRKHNAQICSEKTRGPNNHNWRGGVSAATLAFYRSSSWRTLRKDILRRDNFTCVDCGYTGANRTRDLEVNHIKPRSSFPNLALVPSNLETLCEDCHLIKTLKMRHSK